MAIRPSVILPGFCGAFPGATKPIAMHGGPDGGGVTQSKQRAIEDCIVKNWTGFCRENSKILSKLKVEEGLPDRYA